MQLGSSPKIFLWIFYTIAYFLCYFSIKVAAVRNANIHRNVSDLLDNLLRGYDNSIRPDFGGAPTVVDINIMVRSISQISEISMTYSMDLYFRQLWRDARLAYNSTGTTTLALSISMLEKIWKPDTYFYNGRQSYLHTITTPNKFVRLFEDGKVLYSSRLTVKASCPMHLEDFPMDTQRCPLKLGSFGYTTRDVVYRWKEDSKAVDIASDMKMSQFDLISTPSGNTTDTLKSGKRSILEAHFYFKRHTGFYLLHVYFPSNLLVFVSWVGFWINREATADRVTLEMYASKRIRTVFRTTSFLLPPKAHGELLNPGIWTLHNFGHHVMGVTTVLTMTFLGLEARTDLPKVPYPTALDFFVFLSFAFIFASIIQFAVVHYFTKNGSGEMYFNDSSSDDSDDDENENEVRNASHRNTSEPSGPGTSRGTVSTTGFAPGQYSTPSSCPLPQDPQMAIIELPPIIPPPPPRPAVRRESWNLCGQITRRKPKKLTLMQKQRLKELENVNSVSEIDRAARLVFPGSFLVINVIYWYYYLVQTNNEP